MKRRLAIALGAALLLVLLVAAYMTFAPVPVTPRAYKAPADRGFSGPFARNRRLSALTRVALGDGVGPEDGALDAQGRLHVSLRNGDIARVDDAGGAERWANTSGMPLGIEFDGQGTLWVADAYRGLLSIAPDGRVTVRAAQAAGVPIRYADDVVVARDGTVYFTDASTKFGAQAHGGTFPASVLDLIEHGLHGRVLRHDPRTGRTDVIRRRLAFANGVALTADDATLLIAETGMNRVLGLRVTGPRAGALDVLIDALPGFPDNIEAGREGRFWIGLVAPRSRQLDALAGRPGLRAAVLRLPEAVRPKAGHYGHVFAIDADGKVLEDLQDPDGAYGETTGAVETERALYITSLTEPTLGRVTWPVR